MRSLNFGIPRAATNSKTICGDAMTARTPYDRFYILLPQYQNESLRRAWLDGLSPLVARNMTTVGFSADDAGNGDGLGRRVVYAVNPQDIGTGLTQAWYDANYPGTTLIPAPATSPRDFIIRFWRGA